MYITRRQCLKAAAVSGTTFLFAPLNFNFGSDAISNFEIFQHPQALPLKIQTATETITTTTLGEGGGIFIDHVQKLIKKVYAQDVLCVGGTVSTKYNAPVYHEYFYEHEKKAYLKLQEMGSRYIPRQLSFDDEERSITMSYHGGDLFMNRLQNGWTPSDRHIEQIVEMAHEYRQAGFFKRNICASNLIYDRTYDCLRAIDFKFVVPRTQEALAQEIQHHHLLLRKINLDLPQKLQVTFTDFSAADVQAYSSVGHELYAGNNINEHDHDLRLQLLKKIQAAV